MESQIQNQTGEVFQDVIRTLSELTPASLNAAEIQDLLGKDVRRKEIYAAVDRGVQEGLLTEDKQAMPYRYSYKGAAAERPQDTPAPAVAPQPEASETILAEALPASVVAPATSEVIPAAATTPTAPVETAPAPAGRAVRTTAAAGPKKGRRGGKSEKLAAAIHAQIGRPKQPAGRMMLHLLQQTGEHLTVEQLRERLDLQGSNDSLFKSLRILQDKGEVKREEGVWPQCFYATHPVHPAAPQARPRATAMPRPDVTARATTVAPPAAPASAPAEPAEAPVAAAPAEPAGTPVAPAQSIPAPAAAVARTPAPASVAAAPLAPPRAPRFNAQLDWDGQLHLNINGEEAVLSEEEARRLVRLVVSYHGKDFVQ